MSKAACELVDANFRENSQETARESSLSTISKLALHRLLYFGGLVMDDTLDTL